MAETTWAEALVPWVDAAGRLAANFAVVAIMVFVAVICAAAMFGTARKQEERRIGTLRPKTASGARKLARRIVPNPHRVKTQGEPDIWSL